jgi:hypothetical protein
MAITFILLGGASSNKNNDGRGVRVEIRVIDGETKET